MLRRSGAFLYAGVVHNWASGKSYGFIKENDTDATYFCHREDIMCDSPVNALPQGFRVEFDIASENGRERAVQVRMIGGAPISSNTVNRMSRGAGGQRGGSDVTISQRDIVLAQERSTKDFIKVAAVVDVMQADLRQTDKRLARCHRLATTLAHKLNVVVPVTTSEYSTKVFKNVFEEYKEKAEARRAYFETQREKSAAGQEEHSRSEHKIQAEDLF